jgi:hypothetical protein
MNLASFGIAMIGVTAVVVIGLVVWRRSTGEWNGLAVIAVLSILGSCVASSPDGCSVKVTTAPSTMQLNGQ